MSLEVNMSQTWHGDAIIKEMPEELEKGFLSSARRIAAAAKSLVPVKTGKLKSTIRIRKAKKKKDRPGAFVFAGNRRENIYWHYMVEYGTYDKPAHPFVRPAIYANFNATLEEAKRAGKRVINKKRREARRR